MSSYLHFSVTMMTARHLLLLFMMHVTQSQGSVCPHGNYSHEGRECCQCPAGYHLLSHCSIGNPKDINCEPCETRKTFMAVANAETSCERCTRCDPKGNLEEAEGCTAVSDTVCRCLAGHFCSKPGGHCLTCQPCDTCEGKEEQVACTANNNTVCKEKNGSSGLWALILIPVLAILLIVFIAWKRRRLCFAGKPRNEPDEHTEEEPLKDVDLASHLPAIADELGWRKVRRLALNSGMSQAQVECHQLDHPISTEQTLSLLQAVLDREGLGLTAAKLIGLLRKMNENASADRVLRIIKEAIKPAE